MNRVRNGKKGTLEGLSEMEVQVLVWVIRDSLPV
jgi:hypothetical protein